MAKVGQAFFDAQGGFHRTPDDATQADIARLLGKIGEGDSLAPGIARLIMDNRAHIERIFAEHDLMQKTMPRERGLQVVK